MPVGEEDPNPDVFIKHCVGVKGLYNLGNTCFMNSVLQPLFHVPELVSHFLSPTGHRKGACGQEQPCIACEVDALLVRMYNGNKKPVCPSEMLFAFWKNSSDMMGYEQQDAHEFFLTLRTSLHKALGGVKFNCPCIVHQLFAGVLQSDLTCPHCRCNTETYDPFLDLSLDLIHHGQYMGSIDECLQTFTHCETITMDSYKCNHCGQTVAELSKRMMIRNAPKILVIHLKRFEHGSSRVKIDKHISFPVFLDLQKYVAPSDDPTTDFAQTSTVVPYKLLGVVQHVGTLDSGHYTSYVRYRDQWFYIDDASVTLSSEAAVLASPAYMLFYTSLSQSQS